MSVRALRNEAIELVLEAAEIVGKRLRIDLRKQPAEIVETEAAEICLLYTSDAADE